MSQLEQMLDIHYAGINSGDLDAALSVFAEDCEIVTPNGPMAGVAAQRALGEAFRNAAPDNRLTPLRTFVSGDTSNWVFKAALSDDAMVYQQAVELVIAHWQKGKLGEFGPEELIELFDSQFWILAPEARHGGAGFALKRRLAAVRRELATTTPARP